MRYVVSSVALQGEIGALQESLADNEAIAQVAAYLRSLGFQDEQCIQALAYGCVQQAGKTITDNRISQRALKEVWRCLDRALSRCLKLDSSLDFTEVARARAALLLGKTAFCIEDLFKEENITPQIEEALRAILPQAVPPEAPLPMPEQKFE